MLWTWKKKQSRLTTQKETNQMLMVRKSVQPLLFHQGQCNNNHYLERRTLDDAVPPTKPKRPRDDEFNSRDDEVSSHKTSNTDLGGVVCPPKQHKPKPFRWYVITINVILWLYASTPGHPTSNKNHGCWTVSSRGHPPVLVSSAIFRSGEVYEPATFIQYLRQDPAPQGWCKGLVFVRNELLMYKSCLYQESSGKSSVRRW